jgi:transcriptional regulator with PAS, ATPase and Fis domain
MINSSNKSASNADVSCWGLTRDMLLKILDNITNEIYVLDKNFDILYVSKNSLENYGLCPDEMIGQNHYNFAGKYWFPSVIPLVTKEKRHACIEQVSITGKKFISTAVPVFEEHGDQEMIIAVLQEEPPFLDLTTSLRKSDELASRINILTRSPEMLALMETCDKVAKCDAPVLIQGASGTGISVLA